MAYHCNITQQTFRLTEYPRETQVVLGPIPKGYVVSGGNVGGTDIFCNRLVRARYEGRKGQILFSAKLPRIVSMITVVVRFKRQPAKAA